MTRLTWVMAGLVATGIFASMPAFAKPDCGENTGTPAAGKPIPIGAITSMSGIASFKEADDAVRAYFDCVNANGGIHGRPIAYHDEDDQSKLDVAAQAAKKLVEDEGAYMLVGSTGFVSCVANADYYVKQNILDIGLGIPPQCFQSKNIAEINAGPRQSLIGAIDYARRKLGVKSIVCVIYQQPGSDYICGRPGHPGGAYDWGQKYGVKVTSIYPDPSSPDFQSIALQALATGDDAVQALFVDDQAAQVLNAAEQQDGAAKMKWTFPTSVYTVRFPGSIDTQYWNDRVWINAELGPMEGAGKDNQNWVAVMDAYGKKYLRDTFSQAGYIAARIAVREMLTIKNPDDINRASVTKAVQNMKPYYSDILCAPWYWGGPEAKEHNANHVTRTVTVHDGKFKFVEGCHADADPGLASIVAIEKNLGINKEYNEQWTTGK